VSIFSDIFKEIGNILDVGCDIRQLKEALPSGIDYIGVDLLGKPDILVELDRNHSLPFKDKSFDLVFCSEVLEHLEDIHFVFDELCRVSRKYVILSMPSPVVSSRNYFSGRLYVDTISKQKEFGKYMKFYGLPLEKPRDRHRWFFNTEEAVDFVNYRADLNNCKVAKILYSIDFSSRLYKTFRMLCCSFNKKKMFNLFNETAWFLIKKYKQL